MLLLLLLLCRSCGLLLLLLLLCAVPGPSRPLPLGLHTAVVLASRRVLTHMMVRVLLVLVLV